jgi:hypothetical protein
VGYGRGLYAPQPYSAALAYLAEGPLKNGEWHAAASRAGCASALCENDEQMHWLRLPSRSCRRRAALTANPVQGFRTPRPIPTGSPAHIHARELRNARTHLDRLRIHHIDLAKRFLTEADGAIYTIDLFLTGVMSRSYSLVDGFINAFDTWNPVVAAPLLRMQLDTLVRVAYMAKGPKSDEIASYVVAGGEFRALEDADGRQLTDRRLIELAAGSHPWVDAVYRATSGWVHLSPSHVQAAVQVHDDADGENRMRLFGAVPIRPEQIPRSALQELVGAMIQATEELFGYVETWEARKGLPAGEMRDIRTKAREGSAETSNQRPGGSEGEEQQR